MQKKSGTVAEDKYKEMISTKKFKNGIYMAFQMTQAYEEGFNKGVDYARNTAIMINEKSTRRNMEFRKAVEKWHELPQSEKEEWKKQAKESMFTGFNLFVKTEMDIAEKKRGD